MTKSIILVALLAAGLSVPVQAQDVSVSVGYGDLDLTSETGVARLDRRIGAAVDRVCGDHRDQLEISAVRAVRKCARLTLEDVQGPRQIAIERARGRNPSVELAAGGAVPVTARRR